MATTPRYIATTATAAVTFLRATMEETAFLLVFDSDRDGSVAPNSSDETELARAVCRAETKVDELLGAAYGAPWTSDQFAALTAGTQDAVRECVMEITPWERVKFRASMSDEKRAPYRVLWKDACARLEKLAADAARRLPGAGPAAPTRAGGVLAPVESDSGLTWQHVADGTTSV